MKKYQHYSIIFLAVVAFATGACRKEEVDLTAEYKQQTDDQLLISAEIDAVTIDATTAVESCDYFFARTARTGMICDATVSIDSTTLFKYISIRYNGISCQGKNQRQGEVMVIMQQGRKWSDAGAILSISYINLKITRISDNKSITLNGDLSLTNESGGRLSNMGSSNLVHLINSPGMNILFDDGIKRSWQVSVKRTYSYENGLVITSTGNHSGGNKTGISAWGLTRAGRPFITMIVEPMIIRQDCNFRMVSAKLVQEQNQILTIKFGLNELSETVNCPPASYFLEVSWYGRQQAKESFLLPY